MNTPTYEPLSTAEKLEEQASLAGLAMGRCSCTASAVPAERFWISGRTGSSPTPGRPTRLRDHRGREVVRP